MFTWRHFFLIAMSRYFCSLNGTAAMWANSWFKCIVQTWQCLLLVFIQPTKAAAVCEWRQQMFVLREMPTFELTCLNTPRHNIFCYLPASTTRIITTAHGGMVCMIYHLCSASPSSPHSQHLLLCSTIKFSTIKRKNGGEHVTAVNVF